MKGSYILIINISKSREIVIGSLGKIFFRAGFYAYVGSGMSGLEARVRRHLRKKKKRFWHIDYLLEKARVADVIMIESKNKLECEIARRFSTHLISIKKFGSSDCKCNSHLFYLGSKFPGMLINEIYAARAIIIKHGSLIIEQEDT